MDSKSASATIPSTSNIPSASTTSFTPSTMPSTSIDSPSTSTNMLQQAHSALESGQSVANTVTEGAMAAIHAGENAVEHMGNQFRNEKEKTHAQSLETVHKIQNKAKEVELHQQHKREEAALKKAHQESEGHSITEDIQAGLMATASAKYREEHARKAMTTNTSHAPIVTQF